MDQDKAAKLVCPRLKQEKNKRPNYNKQTPGLCHSGK